MSQSQIIPSQVLITIHFSVCFVQAIREKTFEPQELAQTERMLWEMIALKPMTDLSLYVFDERAIQADWGLSQGQSLAWAFSLVRNFKRGKQFLHAYDYVRDTLTTLEAKVFDPGFGEKINTFFNTRVLPEGEPAPQALLHFDSID